MTEKTKPDAPEEHDRRADPGDGAGADAGTTAAPAENAPDAGGRSGSPSKRPLITAIEIENFKGICAPVRIDMRPITLLFGRNSAGKSTILQALCYAHEILSHRNVDAHKTELGGEQVDLGGFREFVHRDDPDRDPDRAVRLRFDLNLNGWLVPKPLEAAMEQAMNTGDPEIDEENRQWFDRHNPANAARTGWVAFTAAWDRSRGTPRLTSYEVGVNSRLVGRIETDDYNNVKLAFNWTHPLFEPLGGGQPTLARPAVRRVSETADPDDDEWQLLRAVVELQTPMPDWENVLDLDIDGALELEGDIGGPYLFRFEAFISTVLVGVGRTLRDELARLRYVGSLRELRQRTDGPSDLHRRGHWSDGSAAWDLLSHRDQLANSWEGDLLKEVNDWLAGGNRLDTGYRLRGQSTVLLPADAPPVSRIQRHEQLFAEYRSEEGVVDVDKFIRDKKPLFVKKLGFGPDQAETKIRDGFELGLVDIVEQLEKGNPTSDVKALVRAVAKAKVQRTLQLVTADKELPVRTSDIGVGVSQILPVVVAALDPDRPGITAIEQPELHVHPKMQIELGDLFAAALGHPISGMNALERPDRPAGVFLIETHSEHLILRLLRRIEETNSGELPEGKPALKPDQVSVVFLEQTDGEVWATRLRIDETGEFIDRWPQGFFEERDDELF